MLTVGSKSTLRPGAPQLGEGVRGPIQLWKGHHEATRVASVYKGHYKTSMSCLGLKSSAGSARTSAWCLPCWLWRPLGVCAFTRDALGRWHCGCVVSACTGKNSSELVNLYVATLTLTREENKQHFRHTVLHCFKKGKERDRTTERRFARRVEKAR